MVAIELGGTRIRGRVPVKEQQSKTNAIWTSRRSRGANLVYSHSWRGEDAQVLRARGVFRFGADMIST